MQHESATSPVPHLPALGLLQGLARLHQTVLLLDAEGRVLWVSGDFGELSGVDACVVGRRACELFESREHFEELGRRLAADGSIENEWVEVVGRDGNPLAIELSAVPVRAGGGRPVILAIVRPSASDVEASPLRESAGYFRAILESSREAALAVDTRGYVTYANPALERLLGREIGAILDKPVALVFARRAELEVVADALQPGSEGRSGELELADGGGRSRRIALSASPLRLPDGSRAGTVAFLRDVTDERRFEQQLARKNEELEHYVQAVSHDLRTPLVSLLGFSRLLAQDYGDVLHETGRHFLERIEQASRTMEALINDLLELSRIGQTRGQRELVDPLNVLKQLSHEFKTQLDARGIALWLPEAPPLVCCVRHQLYQVLANLIGNAVEHMGEQSGARVDVSVREDDDHWLLCVRDNGVGIPPEEQERVFEIFYTARRRTNGRRGTGIGLAIVRKIAETHGGRAWLESEPGRGAAFFVSLPRS